MFVNRDKAELVNEIYGVRHDPICRKIVALIEMTVDEFRIYNDTASSMEVPINQGTIQGLNRLKENIVQGLPTSQKKS